MTSADLTELLRTSRPVAPDGLRERVRAIADVKPPPSRSRSFPVPRLRLIVTGRGGDRASPPPRWSPSSGLRTSARLRDRQAAGTMELTARAAQRQ